MLKKIFLCALLTLPGMECCADSVSLDQAEKLFQSGDWEKARQAYRAELASQPDLKALPPVFFFNYGTVLSKAGAQGEAYVSLLRAAYFMPFDADVKHNLHQVEGLVPAAVRSVQPALWMSWWPQSLRILPWKLWFLLALTCSAAAFFLAQMTDRTLTLSSAGLAAALFLWGGLGWNQTRLPVYGAISIAKVKSGPGTTFSDITSLEPGSLVNVETSRDGWLKIRFLKPEAEEETVGWVEPATVLQVY